MTHRDRIPEDPERHGLHPHLQERFKEAQGVDVRESTNPTDASRLVVELLEDLHRDGQIGFLENPVEGSRNILRWLVRRDYSDEDIAKVMGGNALRVLGDIWA